MIKRKHIIATIMAVAMSVAIVTTSMITYRGMHLVKAAEDEVYTKLADSTADGFYYREDQYGNIQCLTDKTQVYTSYDEAVKEISKIAKKIFLEDKYKRFSFRIPVEIKTDEKIEQIEKLKVDNEIINEIYKDTGKPNEGHTMSAFNIGGGNLTAENRIDPIKYQDGSYKGYYCGSAGYGSRCDRYHETVKKLDQIVESLDLDGKSDYEKCRAILYWLVCNVKYDSHYNGSPNKPAETEYPHDMTGAVLDGYAVCDGFAGTFYYMANKVGLNALYEDGITNDDRKGHAWNLVEIDGTYYYADPTNTTFGKDGELIEELLPGQKYLFSLYTPDSDEIEKKYDNISQDDYLKEHSVCKGNHNLYKSGGKVTLCEQAGTIRYRCSNPGCLYTYEVETTPALGHIWDKGTITQEQSCTEPEITTYLCTREGCEKGKDLKHGYKKETKPALGHTWNEGTVTKKATCTAEGEKTLKCTRCEETKTESIPKTDHEFVEVIDPAPTCTKKGVSTRTCKNCGLVSKHQINAMGHQHTEIRNEKAATCTKDGYTGDTYCKDCNKLLQKGSVIPATDHQYGDWTKEIDPTCKKYGLKQRECKICGHIGVDTIDKVDHKFELKSTTSATCSVGVIQHYVCSVCGETKDVTLANPTGQHTWELTSKTDATCTKDGEEVYTCRICGTTKTEVIKATGHKNTEIRDQKAATCTEDGYTGDTYCKSCREKLETGSVINKLGHTWDEGEVTKEVTETEEGVRTYTCKTCGKTRTETIPITKHNWDQGTITKKDTCTEDGEKTYRCTDEGCGKTYTEVIPATGHQHTELRNEQAATCQNDGKKSKTCKVCGDKVTETIPKLAHQWNDGEITKKATCKEEGAKTYTCAVCKETKTEIEKATGHHFGSWKTTTARSVFSGGVQERTCSDCKKKETRSIGKKLKATMKTNASSLKLKRKQSTKRFVVSGLAKGDFVRSWNSSNKKLINVSGRSNGTCTIKAGSKTGSAKITIKLASGLTKTIKAGVQKDDVTCTSIKNVPKELILNSKKSYQIKPMIDPITCTYKVKYQTSNKKIIKITRKGKITAEKKGKAKVIVTSGKKKSICIVTVQ